MKLTIPQNDFGQIRVFATAGPVPKTAEAISGLLGATLDLNYIDVVATADLGAMSLTTYIQEGYDMAPDLVDHAALDRVTGTVILVLSRATGGVATQLTLAPEVRHVTTYVPKSAMQAPRDLPDPGLQDATLPTAAKPKKPKSDARVSGMIATYALVAMFALVALMIWVGG